MNLRTGPAGRRSIQRLLAAASLAFICARPALSDEAWARIQGKIVAVDGATLLVRLKERSLEGKILRQRYGETVEARLKDSVVITAVIPAELSGVKQGRLVGVTYVPNTNGALEAVEVHLYPAAQEGFDGRVMKSDFAPGSVLTEGNVQSLANSDGNLTLTISDGKDPPTLQTIDVNAKTPTFAFTPGSIEDLKPGASVILRNISNSGGGVWNAPKYFYVGRSGIELPMMWTLPP